MAISTTPSGMNHPASGSPAASPGNAESRPIGSASPAPPGFGIFGMTVFLFALGVLFTASIVAYLFIRARFEVWPPPNSPRLPAGLWVSTAVIILCSVSIQRALAAVRRERQGILIGALMITLLLGMVFLVSQVVNWVWLISLTKTVPEAMNTSLVQESLERGYFATPARASAMAARVGSLYLFTFYVLTILHALHVVGGTILLAVVTSRAFAGRYSSAYYPGVKYAAMYWHFLDAVWLAIFVLVFLI